VAAAAAEGIMTGTVFYFRDDKGYGFIDPDSGGHHIFVHWTGIAGKDEYKTLRQGQSVEFEVEPNPRGPVAVNVRPL
jgi:CspA family cold shock protein